MLDIMIMRNGDDKGELQIYGMEEEADECIALLPQHL